MQAMLSSLSKIFLQVHVPYHHILGPRKKRAAIDCAPEIYRIVSSKALDGGDSMQNPLSDRKVVEISKSQDPEQKQGCC